MFKLDKDDKTTFLITRGDKGSFSVKKRISDNVYEPFYKGDVVTFSVKSNFASSDVLLRKKVIVPENTDMVTFNLTKEDTSIGDLISDPITYQYDIAINDDITILGYDDKTGPKSLILYPEGSNDE